MKLGAPCFFSLESLQNLWCCEGVSAGVRHRSRVIYLGYCALSFIPKLLHMQHTVQDDHIWEMPSVTVAGTGAMVLMLAGIVSWCAMDQITEANIYILEDPSASRRLFKFLACTTMVCYLYPVLFFGHAQLVAEGLSVIGGVYCLLWVPLMDSSSETHCFVLFWCFLAILRLALVGAEFTGPMEYCLKLYIVEGAVLRFLLRRYTKGGEFRVEARAPLCLRAAVNSESRRQQFLQFFARPTSAERHTSLEAFDRPLAASVGDTGGLRQRLGPGLFRPTKLAQAKVIDAWTDDFHVSLRLQPPVQGRRRLEDFGVCRRWVSFKRGRPVLRQLGCFQLQGLCAQLSDERRVPHETAVLVLASESRIGLF